MDIKLVPVRDWTIVYNKESENMDDRKSGRWICFSRDSDEAEKICRKAVRNNYCAEAKFMSHGAGPVTFYMDGNDREGNRKLISFLLEKDFLPRDSEGKIRDLRFMPNVDCDFKGDLALSDFVDLASGGMVN